MMDPTRIEFLTQALAANPDDRFARYALAVEYSGSENAAEAWPHFSYLLEHHPDYVPAYYQAGTYLARQGRVQQARDVLARGIDAAQQKKDHHAASELQAALDDLDL